MEHDYDNNDGSVATETKRKTSLEKPRLYRVLLHNDHYTTRDFVVEILMAVFHKPESEAVQVMMHVHKQGVGLAGVYTYEIAETKIRVVEMLAREQQFPLKLSMEPEGT